MTDCIWRAIARAITSQPRMVDWLIRRAKRTPYSPITSQDGLSIYMDRWWLFNPYGKDDEGNTTPARWEWLPSIRIHHIRRPDSDRHLHDHPWNARTIVLRGWYFEERPVPALSDRELLSAIDLVDGKEARAVLWREKGYTGRLLFGQYHRISNLHRDGVWTLFFTRKELGEWGFEVDGRKVPSKEYLG